MSDDDVIKLGGEALDDDDVREGGDTEKMPVVDVSPIDVSEAVIIDSVRDAVAVADPESYVVTQHSLIKTAFPHSIPICTDAFMNVSKNHYPLPWLVREITQNFVDENQVNPGSLDGVHFDHTTTRAEDGRDVHTFNITGRWPFKNPTGLISLHSGKTSSATKKNAGGNGIGLKQTVLRFMRDYGVENFEIEGEGWIVKYKMVPAADANTALSQNVGDKFAGHEITDDWLLATVERSSNTGRCTYKIVTDHAEVAKALTEFPNLGVSAENAYLRDPDYENERGAFKWIQIPEDEIKAAIDKSKNPVYDPGDPFKFTEPELPKGRIFINGQVMNYKQRGKTLDTYWDGPELVSIRLNNLDYDMSMDRPPIDSSDLRRYIENLTESMDPEDLLREIKKTEYIWANIEDESLYSMSRKGALVVIGSLVTYLHYKASYNPTVKALIASNFGPKYLYLDNKISEKEKAELREKGYILCPECFHLLGVEAASTKIDAIERVKKEKPVGADLHWQAENQGIEVGFPNIGIKNPKEFFPVFLKKFKKYITDVEIIDEKTKSIRISMSVDLADDLFYRQMITAPKTPDAKSLYELRGFIAYGLQNGIFNHIALSNGDLFAVFDSPDDSDVLLSKVVKNNISPGIHAEVDDKGLVQFLKTFNSESVKKVLAKNKSSRKTARVNEPTQGEESNQDGNSTNRFFNLKMPSFDLRMPSFHFRYVYQILAATFGALGVAWTINNAEPIVQYADVMATSVSRVWDDMWAEDPTESKKFLDWFISDNSYGKAPGNRKGKRSLADILSFYDNSTVGGRFPSFRELWSIEPPKPPQSSLIEDFDIVETPSPSQLKQLEILREYIYLTTGVHVGNKLFIYTGDGAYGVNFAGRGIGLHESLLDVGFDEALSTFTHEVAHNEVMNHGPGFMRMDSILNMAIHDAVYAIAVKEANREPLDDEEALIIRIEGMWDKLRANR